MAIISTSQETINGVIFNQLTSEEDFYACGYNANKEILLFTEEGDPVKGNTIIRSLIPFGFGADTYQEFIDEKERLNLNFID